MKLNKLFIILFLCSISSYAQNSYPQDYFLFPINPGQRNYLSGTMGELRSNHFHGGLDIKTGGVEGVPVLASADGFVQRIKVNSYGYGWVLYLQHPNGMATTYAHLKKFRKDISSYVRSQQYNRESFNIELFPKNDMLAVKQGDTIAWSGNSGSSGGPHLHFEIRDKNQNVMNPLLFGFDEIIDNTAPTFSKLAIQSLDLNGRVNQKYGREEFWLKKTGNTYAPAKPIEAFGRIGVDFMGFDRLDGVSNKNGITYVSLVCNDSICFTQGLESFSFDKNRHLNRHIDYRNFMKSGKKYQHCFIDDGNGLNFYGRNINKGVLDIKEGQTYEIVISAKDQYKNESLLKFTIKGVAPKINTPTPTKSKWHSYKWEVNKNALIIKRGNTPYDSIDAKLCLDSICTVLPVSYYEKSTACYLWDLSKALPDSVVFPDSTMRFSFKEIVASNQEKTYSDENIYIYFPPNGLFDTLYLNTEYAENYWRVNNMLSPMKQNVHITLKADSSLRHPKAAVYHKKWSYNAYVGGTWNENGIKFKTRSLGKFLILKDEIPPYIRLHRKKSNYISFKISDERSGIKSFNASLNGEWVLMNYDHKRKLLWIDNYYWDKKMRGDFELELKDNANNIKIYRTTFE